MPTPNDIALENWSDGWLKMETAFLMGDVDYLVRSDHEKRERQEPVSREEMIAYIREHE